jgi:hypothetical protein
MIAPRKENYVRFEKLMPIFTQATTNRAKNSHMMKEIFGGEAFNIILSPRRINSDISFAVKTSDIKFIHSIL